MTEAQALAEAEKRGWPKPYAIEYAGWCAVGSCGRCKGRGPTFEDAIRDADRKESEA